MNKLFKSLIAIIIIINLVINIGCKKSESCPTTITTATTYPIQGLWIGTYVYSTQSPLYFSFTLYPDNTMSYKSKGNNGYTFYANGTWQLTGTSLTYTVISLNTPGVATQPTQTGSATYNSTNGTLTNGINTDVATGASGTFSMTRVN